MLTIRVGPLGDDVGYEGSDAEAYRRVAAGFS
jgi:hypothetical protein